MNDADLEHDITRIRSELMKLGTAEAAPNNELSYYRRSKEAEKAYRREKYHKRLQAPIRDERDESRKMTADDIDAWVESRPDVEKLHDDMVEADILREEETSLRFDRKDRTSALYAALDAAKIELRLAGFQT